MISRRSVICTSVLGAAAMAAGSADAQEAFNAISEWGFQPNIPLTSGASSTPMGAQPPRHHEIAQAFRLLYNAPRGVQPINVAAYFEQIADQNEDGWRYNQEWPKSSRANPLIVGLFSSTFSVPSLGDQTSWCAAFVNFCLMASGKAMTASAMSGSFRNDPSFASTNNPKPGDIAVFRAAGSDGDKGHGHVAFYLSDDGVSIELLGGNQVGTTRTSGAVTRTRLPFEDKNLTLFGFRKVS